MKFNLAPCLLIFLGITVYAQQTATTKDGKQVILNNDGTWKYADKTAPRSNGVTLKLEAGIVYKLDGPQPVARTVFVLMDADPIPELRKIPATEGRRWAAADAAGELAITCGSNMPEAMSVIQKHARYTLTTGFDGKVELSDIEPGKYWLFGATQLRKGCAFWLLAVDLTKNQSVALDQNNAVTNQ